MTEIKSKDPFFTPDKILDFGSGVGSVSLAADTYYDGPKVKAIEPNQIMKKLGLYMCDKNNRISFYDNLFECAATDQSGQFDLSFCSFVLEEIKTPEERV